MKETFRRPPVFFKSYPDLLSHQNWSGNITKIQSLVQFAINLESNITSKLGTFLW